jgi:uncharacterized protein (TIGR00106 family)
MSEKPLINVSVQVLPRGVDDTYAVVDKAIEVIQASGLKYEVGPMETTIEGDDLDRLLEIAKAAHLACFEAGVTGVMTFIKIGQSLKGSSMEEKVSKYRGVKK